MISEKEFAQLRGIKHSYIKSLRYKNILKQGVHYFKLSERKIFIDENAFDKMLKEQNETVHEREQDLGNLIQKWKKNTQIYGSNGHKREQAQS